MQPDDGSTARLAAHRRIIPGVATVLTLLAIAWIAFPS